MVSLHATRGACPALVQCLPGACATSDPRRDFAGLICQTEIPEIIPLRTAEGRWLTLAALAGRRRLAVSVVSVRLEPIRNRAI